MNRFDDEMATNPEIIESLQKMGLNKYEANAVYALNAFGEHTAGQLSETAKVPRPRIYDVVERLQGKGFVAIQQGRPVKYRALPIGEAIKTLKKQRQTELTKELEQIEAIGKELNGKLKTVESAPTGEEAVWTIKGKDAIYSKLGAMIASAKKHVVFNSTPEGILRRVKAHSDALIKAKAKGVKISFIAPSQIEGETCKLANECIAKDYPTRMAVADDQALLFLSDHTASPDDEVGLWVKSPHLAETLKRMTRK
ncbi:hypothetical protein COX86_00975 [Candidatus Micrarchaeota archaeon CG_4_10_14_0_2_um_filter_60_11]|nr:MAG: hypothetical protein COT58_03795 [Candidatus Micrarchaeota archaeon CG09_land_8_20_14_0_10_60_16]PIY91620.1 MAG: hypothetical protein COY71_02190 [Candidatus Micrarchaeota archaeon CG_4_10_14_0_8_um_filter_60_7]PIZ91196.1 MAG: hypothetical protein COX86_00975 [Candidatus Micrarchaeota archaeon CG_4_10_14_0_2_um_filter_60_11]